MTRTIPHLVRCGKCLACQMGYAVILCEHPVEGTPEIRWLMTNDATHGNRRSINERSGWQRHAVLAPHGDGSTFAELRLLRAACGLFARHGWGDDFFVEETQRCKRCVKAVAKLSSHSPAKAAVESLSHTPE